MEKIRETETGGYDMQSNQKIEITTSQCHLCEQKMNPTAYPFTSAIVLCRGCYHHMERPPEVVIISIERFLVGNVV